MKKMIKRHVLGMFYMVEMRWKAMWVCEKIGQNSLFLKENKC